MKGMVRTFLAFIALVVVSFPGIANAQKAVASSSTEHRIDINSATAEELTELRGVGEKVAARIVSYREDNGPFSKIEEIMNVRGIGEKTFLKLRDRLVVQTSADKSKKKNRKRR